MSKESIPQHMRLSIHPGEWYFGNEYDSLYTVLGSCVALSVWHPTLKLGGLCHYLLPAQPGHRQDKDDLGRYGKTALELLKKSMLSYAALNEYQLGLFGGSDALTNYGIGKQNILFAQRWLQDEKLTVAQVEVGGSGSRSLVLELLTGKVNLKFYPM